MFAEPRAVTELDRNHIVWQLARQPCELRLRLVGAFHPRRQLE
jgi:hypothetical protein